MDKLSLSLTTKQAGPFAKVTWLHKVAGAAFDRWGSIKANDPMLQKHFPDIAEEQGLPDASAATLRTWLRKMKETTAKAKKMRMTFGMMIRFQEWFGWQKTVRAEILPNWTSWLS